MQIGSECLACFWGKNIYIKKEQAGGAGVYLLLLFFALFLCCYCCCEFFVVPLFVFLMLKWFCSKK